MITRRAVLAMSSTASGGLAMLAIAWLAARRLTGPELGFFFSFLSFGALVQLGDLGVSYAALQTAASLAGSGRRAELPGLARHVARWNLAAASAVTLLVAGLGIATFARDASAVRWLPPWLAYLAAVFVNQLTIPRIALREGAGRIAQMWTLRLVQEWVAGAACLVALHRGGALWSLSVYVAARAAIAVGWLVAAESFGARAGDPPFARSRWMAEVWPFQWKIALSGVSGFLIFRAFTPIVLLEKGSVAAGQFGLAISLMNLLIAITTAWPLSHAARYATLNAGGRSHELEREFPAMLWGSTAVAVAAMVTLCAVAWQARAMGIAVALRLPEVVTTFLVFAAAVMHHVVACFAVFLRARGREPLLVASVVGSIGTAIAVWLAAHFGSLRAVAGVNLVCAAVGIPVVLYLFVRRGTMHGNSAQLDAAPR
jgi:hypothetical protein